MVTIRVPKEGVPGAIVRAVLDGVMAGVAADAPFPVVMGRSVVPASDVLAWLAGVADAAEECENAA